MAQTGPRYRCYDKVENYQQALRSLALMTVVIGIWVGLQDWNSGCVQFSE